MSEQITIKKAAVLGAGVMGAQIAAALTTAGVETFLYDLPSGHKDPSAIARGAIKALAKLKPSPVTMDRELQLIRPCNYEDDLEQLKDCDFVLEAISERKSFKTELYEKITPYISSTAVVASNTSGISIEELAKVFPEDIRSRFLGVHFFNPPRYMKLVECIPHQKTCPKLIDQLETFLVVRLGKGVVYAKDTPNFVGNRIGVFAMLSVLHHAQNFGLEPDLVDSLTGPLIGRPKSASYRTMDVVGLDTMNHVVQTLRDGLKSDPWNSFFELPDWIVELVNKGALGQKTRQGVYTKQSGQIVVFDKAANSYRPANSKPSSEVLELFKKEPGERLKALQASSNPQAKFLWSCFRDLFHYCANTLADIAETTRDVDLAMRWGYGWAQGPFELWQQAGVQAVSEMITHDIEAGLSMSQEPLKTWFDKSGDKAFYKDASAFAPAKGEWHKRSELACYQRQMAPTPILEEPHICGETIFENDGLRLWTLNQKDAIVSFKTKKCCISSDVLEGMLECVDRAEKGYESLILWQNTGTDFSVGANLKEIVGAIQERSFAKVDTMIQLFHKVALKLKYASVPTISALRGMCLGGGTEFALHTHARVAAFETYMGLPEVAIGVIPAGGGCKEMLYRASAFAHDRNDFKPLEQAFEKIAKAQVSTSGQQAQAMGFLTAKDKLVANQDEILFVAHQQAQNLKGPAFHPSIPFQLQVAGRSGHANFMAMLVNMREGDFISDHDFTVGSKLSTILCGGDVDHGTLVDEQWLLALEKDAFMSLVESPLTLARIEHTLKTGKPLRN